MKFKKRIRLILWENDFSVAGLARSIKKSRQWTSAVLYGHVKSAPTRRAIARALGLKVNDLWSNGKGKAA